ncbi:MAG: MFS transporter [Alphaproteobacteria bacterium]|nr:MFS transporter [Alphaproteobacteria bacterium]
MPPASKPALGAWCLFDWANSAYFTVIVTFVFATYFTEAVATDPTAGTVQWGHATSVAGLLTALLAPILGAVADQGRGRKLWAILFSLLCIFCTALLWQVRPMTSDVTMALSLVVVATLGAEFALVFYNAMLPGLVPSERLGRMSGFGWGIGYLGGLGCLAVALVGFVQTDTPWFGVGKEQAAHIRATAPMVALWYLAFLLPFAFLTPDAPGRGYPPSTAIKIGLGQLGRTLKEARQQPDLWRFLLANMLYTDGLTTLFAFGGIYAAGTFGFTFAEVIQFGIALNVTAAIGAVAFGWVDDRMGAKTAIAAGLLGLLVCGAVVLVSSSKLVFWIAALLIGLFLGPVQAASRTWMARYAPEERRAELFGLMALSGKATAFLGPLLLAEITRATGSQRWGMAIILVFFAVGLALLASIRDPQRA